MTFLWDDDDGEGGNVSHIVRHRVSPRECEEVRRGLPDVRRDTRPEHPSTWAFIGRTEGGRKVLVAVQWADQAEDTMRVVTAYEI